MDGMMRSAMTLLLAAGFVLAQMPSPPAETSATINGKKISIHYAAPSLRGRHAFGPNGIISHDPTYPVWRAGANEATALHTDAPLQIGNLTVPAGNYTLFVDIATNPWRLIVNKRTGEWGLDYTKSADLGRVPMTMTKPAAPIETYKMTLTDLGGNRGKLELAWEDVVASVNFMVR